MIILVSLTGNISASGFTLFSPLSLPLFSFALLLQDLISNIKKEYRRWIFDKEKIEKINIDQKVKEKK